MALLAPFRALRPTPAAAEHVAAVPYDVVNTEEAAALAAGHPLTFLRVSRAEIELPPNTDPYADAVYRKARENFEALKKAAPLVVEESPSLYVYRLQMGGHQQTGVVACFSLDEYERDLIRKHERTRRDKEDDRTRHILELRAQTGPVFLTYKASPAVDEIVDRASAKAAVYDFVAADEVRHVIWTVERDDHAALEAAFAAIPHLYIADGHHRAASAARARREVHGPEADWFIAVAFPDNQMQILPYNRVVKDLAGYTPDTFLEALKGRVAVGSGTAVPAGRGRVSMFLGDAWHELDLRGLAPETSDPADALDVALLERHVLREMLDIKDVRTDTRIDFVGGIRGTAELEARVNSGRAAVAFAMHPVTIDDLMRVSDTGGIMPPKSTWFEPKLRDGLLVHEI